eukprot:TRINITY_DN33737_c0_g1_i1.p1 TRINITY_DN33737_c0_g1~~TRINITY_DN33737_c0_g1_i1.p1  ORF type:complete len:426 (+),score=37.79 TRINITY_DN33737_c0_g1_i1:124-1401(+)
MSPVRPTQVTPRAWLSRFVCTAVRSVVVALRGTDLQDACVNLGGESDVCEPMGFYERTAFKLIAYLHEGLTGQRPVTASQNDQPISFPPWCVRVPLVAQRSQITGEVLPLRSADDIALVVMTTSRFENTRVHFINQSWGSRFPRLIFASDGDGSPLNRAGQLPLERIYPPPVFLSAFEPGSYMSHVYKGFIGLSRIFERHPNMPWYGILDDDTYVFDVFLTDFLQKISARPWEVPLCAGHVVREQKENHWITLLEMFRVCERLSHGSVKSGSDEAYFAMKRASCKEKAASLHLPFVNLTFVHGAGIFCSHAAMLLLLPHLGNLAVTSFERHSPEFVESTQPYDQLLGRCLADLGIRSVDMHGYFGGHFIPGAIDQQVVQHPGFREGFSALRLRDVRRPALWHRIRSPLQFDALDYISSVIRSTLA